MGTPPCRWALAAWASTSHPPRAPLVPSRQPRQPRHRASNRPRHPPQRAPPSSSSTRRWPYSRRSRTRPRTSSPRCSPGPSSPKSSPASPSPRRPRGRRQPSSPRSPSCLAVGVYARVSRCALSLSLSHSRSLAALFLCACARARLCMSPSQDNIWASSSRCSALAPRPRARPRLVRSPLLRRSCPSPRDTIWIERFSTHHQLFDPFFAPESRNRRATPRLLVRMIATLHLLQDGPGYGAGSGPASTLSRSIC